jgi:hypothetical protein
MAKYSVVVLVLVFSLYAWASGEDVRLSKKRKEKKT